MIHLGDSSVGDIYNMDFVNENKFVNFPSPISLQHVNSNSRTHTHGYNKHSHFSDSAIWSKAFRNRRQLFTHEFRIPEAGVSPKDSRRVGFKRIGEEASFRIRKMCRVAAYLKK